MSQNIVVKIDDKLVKVPLNYLPLDVEGEQVEQVLHLKGNIVSMVERVDDGNTWVDIVSNVPYLSFEMNLSRVVEPDRVSRNANVSDSLFERVWNMYMAKHGKLKLKSRRGFQIYVCYDKANKNIRRDNVKMRSAHGHKHLLLPNLYDSRGNVCWGSDSLPNYENYDDMMNGLMNVYLSAPFNLDLSRKRVLVTEFTNYLDSCLERVASLDGWDDSEKSTVTRMLTSLKDGCDEGSNSMNLNCYIAILLCSIFGDDIGWLSGELVTDTVTFKGF